MTPRWDKQRNQQRIKRYCTGQDVLCSWGMAFNVKKCEVMHIERNNPESVYSMDGHQLEVSEVERDIGVMMTSSLKPSAQCAKAARTAQAVLGQIS